MEINNQQLNPNQLLKLYKNIDSNKNNVAKKETLSNNSSNKLFLTSSMRSLDSSLQKIILQNWIQQNLPLKENELQKIVSLINNNSFNIDNEQLIKIASFLTKNKLPLSTYLIKGVAQFLESKSSISQEINKTPELKGQLSVNAFNNSEQIKLELEQYFQKTGKLLEQLFTQEQDSNSNLKGKLIGQQAINARRESLLFIEIPLFFSKQKDTPTPLFLKYNQLTDNKSSVDKNKYSIEFIIELSNLGTIRARILIDQKKIYSSFKASTEQTVKLINKYFPNLQKRLSEKGFNALEPEIKEFQEEKPIFNFLNENFSEESTDFHHINFKV